MRVAINLLTDDPGKPTGAHWFWTRVIPEVVERMTGDEELHLVVSPKSRPHHAGYGDSVRYITYPWSNERRSLRTLSEHVYSPLRLPASRIDIFNTLMAPIVAPGISVVAHFKTMHAYTAAGDVPPAVRLYRRMSYPRTARVADAIIINSESIREEVHQHLEVDDEKLHLIPEAVDHDLFTPGDRAEAEEHLRRAYGISAPFVLYVSSLWPYKNCLGLIRAFALARAQLPGHRLVIVGPDRDESHSAELHATAEALGVADDIDWVGGVELAETVKFYRAAAVLSYASLNETFGLPLLEAMACGCPVVTSNVTAMPETAGGAALLADPTDPESIAEALVKATGPARDQLIEAGLERAAEFTWAATGEKTLEVYRQVHARRSERRRSPR